MTAPREPSDTTLPPDPGLFTLQVTPTAAELSVATVSSTGTVVAVAPGSTVLSETPMLLGFTRRVSVNTIVRAPGSDSGRLPGSERQLSPGGGISRDRPRLVSRKRDAVDHDACEPVHPRYSKLYQNLQRSRGDRGGRCALPGGSGAVPGQVDHEGPVGDRAQRGRAIAATWLDKKFSTWPRELLAVSNGMQISCCVCKTVELG